MILLDPDLDQPPDPAAHPAVPSPESRKSERDGSVPSVRTLNAFLREAQAAVRLKGMVSVLLTTNKALRTLNRDFRGRNKATDVLSFPAAEVSRGEVAGDLAISVETARRQAREHGHPLRTEIKVLMLHGLLHLAGYDHEKDQGEMARKERTLRAKLALPLGLIERSDVEARRLPTLATERTRASAQKRGRPDGARSVRGNHDRTKTADPSTSLRSAQEDSAISRKGVGGGAIRPSRRKVRP